MNAAEQREPFLCVAAPRPWWLAPEFVGLTGLRNKLVVRSTDTGPEASARQALGLTLLETERLLMTFGPHSAANPDDRLRLDVQPEGSTCLAFDMEMVTSKRFANPDLGIAEPRRATTSRLAAELVELAELRIEIVRALPTNLGHAEASARNAFGRMLRACEGFLERFAASLDGMEGELPRVRRFDRERDTTRVAWSLRIRRSDEFTPEHL